jgi:FkbM family methyltransferase
MTDIRTAEALVGLAEERQVRRDSLRILWTYRTTPLCYARWYGDDATELTFHNELMNISRYLRQFLRRYGRAAVVTVHERLDTLEQQSADVANTQTALLESSIHMVETQRQMRTAQAADFGAVQSSLDRLFALHDALRESSTASLERIAHHGEALAPLTATVRDAADWLANQSVRQVCVETSDYVSTNPELGLMAFLYSYLPGRNALDIGAHVGDVSQYLVNAGYDVYAFEPYPPSYARLTERLRAQPGFHAFQSALGSSSGEAPLHLVVDSTADNTFDDPTVFHSLAPHGMPDGLAFENAVSVPVQRLADLHRDGVIPSDISLVKIDTEGYDLEVIRGMNDHLYNTVVVEFWDEQIPFANQGLNYTLEDMVGAMRTRGYLWYIVLYRVWGQNQTAYFCNHDRAVPHSWGNIFFFQERGTFAQAQQWCSAVLPRTYFKAVGSAQPARQLANGTHG